MSGYLQRLAATAVRPERRVQPLVGGLYTKQPEQAFEEVATTIVPRTATPGSTPHPAATTNATGPRISSIGSRMEETTVRSAAVETSAAPLSEELGRPLLPPVKRDSVFPSQYDQRTEGRESPTRRIGASTSPDLLVPLPEFIERPVDSQRGVPSDVETSETLQATSLKPASAGPVQSLARPPAAQLQTPSVRTGGDDIQIHIGRIEVIAVPQQTAARPVAAPVRRGPSLEEYLQRRDRRSR